VLGAGGCWVLCCGGGVCCTPSQKKRETLFHFFWPGSKSKKSKEKVISAAYKSVQFILCFEDFHTFRETSFVEIELLLGGFSKNHGHP